MAKVTFVKEKKAKIVTCPYCGQKLFLLKPRIGLDEILKIEAHKGECPNYDGSLEGKGFLF